MMWFQGTSISGAEGGREFCVWVLEGVAESLGGEIETSDKPEEAFGCRMLF